MESSIELNNLQTLLDVNNNVINNKQKNEDKKEQKKEQSQSCFTLIIILLVILILFILCIGFGVWITLNKSENEQKFNIKNKNITFIERVLKNESNERTDEEFLNKSVISREFFSDSVTKILTKFIREEKALNVTDIDYENVNIYDLILKDYETNRNSLGFVLISFRNNILFEFLQYFDNLNQLETIPTSIYSSYGIIIDIIQGFVQQQYQLFIDSYYEIKRENIKEIDNWKFLKSFKTYTDIYINEDMKLNFLLSNFKNYIRYSFNFTLNPQQRLNYKYDYYFNVYKNKPENLFDKRFLNYNTTLDEYITKAGIFLENYKQKDVKDGFIKTYLKKNKNINVLSKERIFKEHLKFIWKLGLYLTKIINTNSQVPSEHLKLFNDAIENLMQSFDNTTITKFPFMYDWFLFANYYTVVISYKLYIQYRLENKIEKRFIYEIYKNLPQINFSKNIKRKESNVAIMAIPYILAKLFQAQMQKNTEFFTNYLKELTESNIFLEDILINYRQSTVGKLPTGLYFDGGFIVHTNIVSYNYLLAYLFPSLFFEYVLNIKNSNFNKIFKSINSITAPNTTKLNPALVTRFGSFDEIHNSLANFFESYMKLNLTNEDYYFQQAKNRFIATERQINLENYQYGIKYFDSSNVVIANYPLWSFQYKINSELAYGEVDIYNKNILKQVWMNKIILIHGTPIKKLESHSFYPGVISYRKYLEEAETVLISKGTETFTLKENKYTYKCEENLFISYSISTNELFKIAFDEFLLITRYGIIVGYFNIKPLGNQRGDLFLTIDNTNITLNQVKSNILYNDSDDLNIYQRNTASFTRIKSNILYYNFVEPFPPVSLKYLEFFPNEQKISFILKINLDLIDINLDRQNGVTFSIHYRKQ